MAGTVAQLPDGCQGFDADCVIDLEGACAWVARGHRFVGRYIRREPRHDYDLSRAEIQALHDAGLAVFVIQHVAPEPWRPSAVEGSRAGNVAVEECLNLALPASVTVVLDLEGVAPGTPAADIIGHCQEWYQAVRSAHFAPALYVGWNCGLTADELYHSLSFPRYIAAYNAPVIPSVRGYCMRQRALPNADRPIGYHDRDGIDGDVVRRDNLGGLPTAWAPEGWAA